MIAGVLNGILFQLTKSMSGSKQSLVASDKSLSIRVATNFMVDSVYYIDAGYCALLNFCIPLSYSGRLRADHVTSPRGSRDPAGLGLL